MTQELITRLLLSVLIGGAIGAEREYRSKSAGFRTLTLICLGATLFTILSQLISGHEPERIASNVVVGIGFVGAGVISVLMSWRLDRGRPTRAAMLASCSSGCGRSNRNGRKTTATIRGPACRW